MRKSIILPVFLLFFCQITFAQKQKNIFPIWTYHQKNVNIYGVSLGLGSITQSLKNTNTFGLKIEIPGIGLAMPLIPRSMVAENDSIFQVFKKGPISEHIYGFAISASGTACDCVTNGVSAGTIGQYNFKVNGISAALFMNMTQVHNGIQMAFLSNDSHISNGIQIGFGNSAHINRGIQIGVKNYSDDLRGIQIGLWNVNPRRKMPFINWNFRKMK
jgi:hypothetical protein